MTTADELYEQIRAEVKANPDRRPVRERIAELPRAAILCYRPGTELTHDDIDAVIVFMRFLRRAKRVRGD